MKYHVLTDQGSRDHMEDFHVVAPLGPDTWAVGVFDGHSGHELSQFCASEFARSLAASLKLTPRDPVAALKSSLTRLDTTAKRVMPSSSAGTTACVALITPDAVVTANIGDSRAILFNREILPSAARQRSVNRIPIGTTYQLSRDHKPSDPDEVDRIMQHGGFVTQPHHTDGVHRVMGRLSLSRALGDWDMRPWVSQDADVTVHRRNTRDDFMVLATDGVWDVMSSDEVAASVRRSLSDGKRPVLALQRLLKTCRDRGSGDNITIVLLQVR